MRLDPLTDPQKVLQVLHCFRRDPVFLSGRPPRSVPFFVGALSMSSTAESRDRPSTMWSLKVPATIFTFQANRHSDDFTLLVKICDLWIQVVLELWISNFKVPSSSQCG
jgi:hypothetical protein